VEKSSVRVLAPEHIRGHHDAAIGNFGVPDYGGTLTGVVLYPDAKATGCAEFPAKFKSKSGRPVILLLDRGGTQLFVNSWFLMDCYTHKHHHYLPCYFIVCYYRFLLILTRK
jgi:hypothetical protein